MKSDELLYRLRRIYAAVGLSEETDMSKLKPKITSDGKRVHVYQDFTGDMSDEELDNIVYSLVQNTANLHDHLKKWATKNGKDKSKVDETFRTSAALRIIYDLSNNEKHGYPPRGGGESGKSPRLGKITRILQLTTASNKKSVTSMTLDPKGILKVSGSGSAKVITSAEILDKDGNVIGDLRQTALEAIEAWEHLLSDFGIRA